MSDVVIRLPQLAMRGESLAGELPLARLTRLCQQLPATPGGMLQYHLAGECAAGGCLFFTVQLSARLPLRCRRCSEVFEHPLASRQRFWLSGAAPPPSAADAQGCEELEAGEFSLEQFLTDELLLSLPAAPVHAAGAVCRVVTAA